LSTDNTPQSVSAERLISNLDMPGSYKIIWSLCTKIFNLKSAMERAWAHSIHAS
jgi:hypothetical protein